MPDLNGLLGSLKPQTTVSHCHGSYLNDPRINGTGLPQLLSVWDENVFVPLLREYEGPFFPVEAKLLTRVTDCTVCGYRLFLLCKDGD